MLLTGEVGTGKTTICRCLMEQLPDTVDLALNLNPRLTEIELLASICDELRIAYPKGTDSLKLLVDLLNQHLLNAHARGRRSVLIIDEAQNLTPEVLEQVRLLTNLETAKTKLLQIILIGQPELNEILSQKNLRQLAQRVTARCHLEPLGESETKAYIGHRLAVVGLGAEVFGPGVISEVYRQSGGVPRLINSVCDRCMLGAYTQNKKRIDLKMVRTAAEEVLGKRQKPAWRRSPYLPWITAAAGIAAGVALVVAGVFQPGGPSPSGDLRPVAGATASATPTADAAADAKATETPDESTETASLQEPASTTPEVDTDAGSAPSDESKAAQEAETMESTASGETPAQTPTEPSDPGSRAETTRAATPEPGPEPDSPKTADEKTAAEGSAEAPEGDKEMAALAATDSEVSPTQPDPLTPDSLFTDADVSGDLETALVTLFERWDKKYFQLSGFAPCTRARTVGLQCLQGKGTWRTLYYLNRPALITLTSPKGDRIHGVITAHTGQTITLNLGGPEMAVEAESLSPYWSGEFLLLWKPPAIFRRNIKAGLRGRDVAWVKRRMAEVRGEKPASDKVAFFNSQLKERVLAFQAKRLLKKDGIVGVRTLIHLNTVANASGTPLLFPDNP